MTRAQIVISDNVLPRCECGKRHLSTCADRERETLRQVGAVDSYHYALKVRVECAGCGATWTWGEP